MAEVADHELAVLRNSYGLLATMDNNPESKRLLEQALKVVKPEVVTEEEIAARLAKPYIDEVKATQAQLQEFLDGQKARDEAQAAAAATSNVNAAFARLAKVGYQEDGLAKIKQLMLDRNIADPEAAAALFDKQNPPQEHQQPGWTPQSWEIGSTASPSTDLKELFANEDAWADREAGRVLNEIRLGEAA
jgi:hypothetical protein